jgi:glutamine cyclotransferase
MHHWVGVRNDLPTTSPLRVGQVIEIDFPTFTPRITVHSERELTAEIVAGDNSGFSDTVEYETVAVRNGLVIPVVAMNGLGFGTARRSTCWEESMKRTAAEVVREYGPFPGVDHVHGVTYDGQQVWVAAGDKLIAFDPVHGKTLRAIDVAAHAGTAFDGRHLFQISADRILKIDPQTGRVLATIPAPGGGRDSGLAWAEGTLWVGQYRDRKIHQIDPQTGAILRTIESKRFVTGVTWIDGELWHGTWEGDESDLRRVDPRTGEVLERLEMPPGVSVSGLESDRGDLFFCGGGSSGKVRAVRRPKRSAAMGSGSEIPVDSTSK